MNLGHSFLDLAELCPYNEIINRVRLGHAKKEGFSMRKVISMILCLCFVLCGCGSSPENQPKDNTKTISFAYGDRTGPYIGYTDKNGLPHGYGVFSSKKSDGTNWTYSGQWDHGHWNGLGQTVWDNGESHSGFYTNDEIGGLGIYTAPTGEISIGNIDGNLNGQGIHIASDGVSIMGNFVDGVPTGYCSVYLTGEYEGYVFWGYYENGNAEGTVFGWQWHARMARRCLPC